MDINLDSVKLSAAMVFPTFASHNGRDLSAGAWHSDSSDNENSFGLLAFIFVVFAAYGSAFSFAGQLRYVEAVLLVIGLLSYDKFLARVDALEWKFSGLFLLTALAQFVSNSINHAPPASTVARVGTYVLLAALVPIVAVVVNREWRRLLAVVFGFAASFYIVTWMGGSVSEDFDVLPWRLGLGAATTLMAVALFAVIPRARLILTIGLFALAGLHVYLESRSLAAITLVVALYCLVTTFWARAHPAALKLQTLSAIVLAFGFFAYAGPLMFTWLAEAKLVPDSLVTKNQLQAANRYGLLAAARPDTFTALYAISKKPIIGYGSGVFDTEVFAFYAEVNAASYRDAQLSRNVFKNIYQQDWLLGIPSHSHLFGAWADAGFFAAISWLFVLWFDLKMLSRLWRWGHPLAPLFVFIGIETLWDVLFSPGPVRLDIAIRLVIMVTAFRYMVLDDVMANWRRAALPEETPN